MASNRRAAAEASDDSSGGILSLLQCGNNANCVAGGDLDQCDFDKNPTGLYIAIHTKRWALAAERVKVFPGEASTWVYRRTNPGQAPSSPTREGSLSPRAAAQLGWDDVRWRMLPIHAAVIFEAPPNVLRALLDVYPQGCKCRDDQGMLPLHLAFRTGSPEEIVLILLGVYPEAIEQVDSKGRLPSVLAEKSVSEYSDVLAESFVRGPTYYYYAVRVSAADRVSNECKLAAQLKDLESKAAQVSNVDKAQMQALRKDAEDRIRNLEEENENLKEKMSWYETKYDGAEEKQKVLVDHTNSLAERLRLTSLSEEHLATKLAKLEAKLSAKEAELESSKSKVQAVAESAKQHNDLSSNKTAKLQQKLEAVSEKLKDNIKESKASKARYEKEREVFEKQLDASKECLLEMIASSKADKAMHERDTKELKNEISDMRSDMKNYSSVPKGLEDKIDSLQQEVMKSMCSASVHEGRAVEVVVNQSKNVAEIETTPYLPRQQTAKKRYESECELYVSTSASCRSAAETRDDDGTTSLDESYNISEVDTAIALGNLTEEQRISLEMLDLSGGKEEIAATLRKVPGLTRNQINLLVDVASSLAS